MNRLANYKRGSYNYANTFKAPRQNPVIAAQGVLRRANIMANRRIPNYGAKKTTETKTFDAACSMTYSNNGTVAQTMQLLNTIPQDASPTGRIGKKCLITGVAIRGMSTNNTVLAIDKVTLLLVYVRNNNQAATLPAWAEILAAQTSNALTNRDNASKFKILRRWDYKILGDLDSTTPTCDTLQITEEFVKFKKPLECMWTNAGTAGTIGQFEKGSLILMTVGNQTQASGGAPIFIGNTRVYFQDA